MKSLRGKSVNLPDDEVVFEDPAPLVPVELTETGQRFEARRKRGVAQFVVLGGAKAVVDKPARTDEIVDDVVVAHKAGIADVDRNVFLDGVYGPAGSAGITIKNQPNTAPGGIWKFGVGITEAGERGTYTTTGLIWPLLKDHAWGIR